MRKTLFLFLTIFTLAISNLHAQLTARNMSTSAFYGIGEITCFSTMTNYEFIGTESSGIFYHYIPSSTSGWTQINNLLPAVSGYGYTWAIYNKVLAVITVGNYIYISLENNGVYRLNFTGGTGNWTAVNTGLPSSSGSYKITSLGLVGNKIVAGTNAGGVYSISNTGILPWTAVSGISTVIPNTSSVTQILTYSDGTNLRLALVAGKRVYLRQTTLTTAGTWGAFNAVYSPVVGVNVDKLGVVGSTYKLVAMTRTYTPGLMLTFFSRYNPTTDSWSTISSLPYSSNYLNTFSSNGTGVQLSYLNTTNDFYKQNSSFNINSTTPAWLNASSTGIATKEMYNLGSLIYVIGYDNVVYVSGVTSFREGSVLSENETNNSSISIYPNPTSNHFQIKGNNTEKYEVILSDMQGRIIERFNGELNDINSKLPSTSTWKNGVYLIQINNHTTKESSTLKLMKS